MAPGRGAQPHAALTDLLAALTAQGLGGPRAEAARPRYRTARRTLAWALPDV
jgi:hypothetical protein